MGGQLADPNHATFGSGLLARASVAHAPSSTSHVFWICIRKYSVPLLGPRRPGRRQPIRRSVPEVSSSPFDISASLTLSIYYATARKESPYMTSFVPLMRWDKCTAQWYDTQFGVNTFGNSSHENPTTTVPREPYGHPSLHTCRASPFNYEPLRDSPARSQRFTRRYANRASSRLCNLGSA